MQGELTEIPEKGIVEWSVGSLDSLKVNQWYDTRLFSSLGSLWMLSFSRRTLNRYRTGTEIFLQLHRKSVQPSTLHVEYTFSVKAQHGVLYDRERNAKKFNGLAWSPQIAITLENFRNPNELPDGTLIVVCHLKRINPPAKDSGPPSLLQKNKVLQDLKDLYLNQEECDVVIKVQGQEFPALKAILMARSPVFASAFRSDMKEKATGVIDIEDCDPSSFSDFLCYLYCGVVENLSVKNVYSLFVTADKYDVQDLRLECVEFMKKNLSAKTFYDTILLAVQYSETQLVDLTIVYYTNNVRKFLMTEHWDQFATDNPMLSKELMDKFLLRIKNRNRTIPFQD